MSGATAMRLLRPPDVNADGSCDVFDFIYLEMAIFEGGQQPLWIESCPYIRGDVDASGTLDVFDLIALIDYLFSGVPFTDPCLAPLAKW